MVFKTGNICRRSAIAIAIAIAIAFALAIAFAIAIAGRVLLRPHSGLSG